VQTTIRRRVRKTLHGQGEGRYTAAERARLADRAMAAIADVLGDRSYLMGAQPCGADATVFAFLQGARCPLFEGPLRSAAEAFPVLVAYCDRVTARYYSEEEGGLMFPALAPR